MSASVLSASINVRRLFVVGVLAVLAACSTPQKRVAEGEYRVVKGDTLTQIARRHGQSVASLMRMNNLRDPNHIRVGQILRVQGGTAPAATASPPSGGVVVSPPSASGGKPGAAPRAIKLVWPAQGQSRRGTSSSTAQGIYIKANAGTPVKAAAAGQVAYAGDGLRGYGNMLIVRHDANFLSVYAHNDRLLVKEGARVSQGQQIATMGSTGTDAVQVYFELRYDGRPVDAMLYLPR